LSQARWDIFCSVVDNYGDVGVAWRLARQLASEHDISVRLFVDDMPTFARIAPGVDPARVENVIDGVCVRRWTGTGDDALPDDAPTAVIEMFGCGAPSRYSIAMARRAPPCTWIILEYLSAESWVESHHKLPSPHPGMALARHFFFPGFTSATGGLLRERGLLARRDAFQSDARAQAEFWRAIGVAQAAPDAIVVSLFCYPDAPVPVLLDAWADGDDAVLCVLPEGVAAGALDRWSEGQVPPPGESLVRGRLVIARVPFLSQDNYDRLLWASDINFVRGEDSFVRAQWAGRPFVWSAYAQTGNAHALKLDAFLARYGRRLAPGPAAALRSFSTIWNGSSDADTSTAGTLWPALAAVRRALDENARAWAQILAGQSDLATALVKFVLHHV